MTTGRSTEIAGEHALRGEEKDRLGFAEVASRIAGSIIDRASKDGLVIGIDGEWGAGKSSLLHLIERSLGKLPAKQRPTIVTFRPWLVGDRDALLATLFSELADKIAHVHLTRGDPTRATKRRAERAATAIRKFGRVLAGAGELLEHFDTVVPGAGVTGKISGSIGKALGKEQKPLDLNALKDKISKELKELGHRFIITVDDVDRLEPKELIEVLRLVRSVADFPNIIYLLCYDANRVAEAIRSAAQVEDGAAYLEKIVQLTIMLPKPEPFELRQWFQEDLQEIIGTIPNDVHDRLKMVIDQEGGRQLRTPRSVVRTLDSIRFFWPALRDEKIDVADLVWLQLLKDGSPKFYRWVEGYVASAASLSFGTATVSDSGKVERLNSLIDAASHSQLKDKIYSHMLAELLPGLEVSYSDNDEPIKLYQSVDKITRQRAVKCRRLASPDHYSLYFSLTKPTHAITQSEFDAFWVAVDASPEETAKFILGLHRQKALGSLRKSDILFERLRGLEMGLLSNNRARNLLLGLGQMMDDAYRLDPNEDSFIVDSWDRADRLVPILYAQLASDERESINKTFFSISQSLGWLTSILRRETFAHGKYGDQKKRHDEWWIPEEDFENTCQIMIDRYQSTSLSTIVNTPRPIHIFFAWSQAGDVEGPRQFLQDSVKSDEGLIDAISIFVTSVDSSDQGRYYTLKRDNISKFLDYDAIMQRLSAIAESGPAALRERAKELVAMATIRSD